MDSKPPSSHFNHFSSKTSFRENKRPYKRLDLSKKSAWFSLGHNVKHSNLSRDSEGAKLNGDLRSRHNGFAGRDSKIKDNFLKKDKNSTCALAEEISIELMSNEAIYNHLNKVSRSFALTIPLMPNPLRDYIALAYLMCRIVDTVEDDAKANIVDKITWLSDFSFLAGGDFADLDVLYALKDRALELTKNGSIEDDIKLVHDLDKAVNLLLSYDDEVKVILCRALSIMSHGMAHFLRTSLDEDVQEQGIKDLDDVDNYCYFVAGVVGEMLAELFALHDKSVDKKELLDLSVSFGEGLQLTNILRDRAKDLERGASFLLGNSEDEVLEYVALTEGHLNDAINFICALDPKQSSGVRLFCLTNVVMAMYLLRQVARNPLDPKCNYKISRAKLKRLFLMSKLANRSNFGIRLFSFSLSLGMRSQRRSVRQLRDKVSIWDHSPNTNQLLRTLCQSPHSVHYLGFFSV